MAFQRNSRNRRKARHYILQKPRGVVHPQVQAVGPEHFAFLCIDCAKARSKIMLADFDGRVLIESTRESAQRNLAVLESCGRAEQDYCEVNPLAMP